MRIEAIKKFVADDGTTFDLKEDCLAYEQANMFKPLLNMKAEHLTEAMTRSTEKGKLRADLIERLAGRIEKVRKEQGDYRRAPKAEETEADNADASESAEAA